MEPTDGRDAYDHVRPRGAAPVDPGVYRVVGTDDETATLLRVADADGGRRHTGDLVTVDRDALAGFDRAENPDANRSLADAARSQGQGLWWNLRVLGGTVLERPLAGGAALALVVAGFVGDRVVSVPDAVEFALVLVGAFGLVYLSRSGSLDAE